MSRTKLIVGVNDLSAVNPTLARQWHPTKNENLTPDQVTTKSSKKVWWLCENGHDWQATVWHRTHGSTCPVCAELSLSHGASMLSTTHMVLVKQWHPTKNGVCTPERVLSGSMKKIWWLCENGHTWQATVKSRMKDPACPYCTDVQKDHFSEE